MTPWWERKLHDGRNSGLAVAMIKSGACPPRSASARIRSSEVGSAQCRSSNAIASGCDRALASIQEHNDPKQAAATRVKLLDMLAANRIAVMSYHFAWPGYGHVAKTGEGFHYYPDPMQMLL